MINFGMDKTRFKDDYFEKRFFFKEKAASGLGFDTSALEEVLDLTVPNSNKFRLMRKGSIIDEKNYTKVINDIGSKRPVVVKEKFYEFINNGATLVLNRVDLSSTKIKRLCSAVTEFSGFPASANGYFATSGDGTFGNHWDTHDVFAIQLFGRKRWKIYEPTFLLPVSSQISLHKKADCPEKPIFDDYLNEGDCIYIPRGFWHNATPTAGETFHIAIGVHTVKVWDYLKWAVSEILPSVYECRQTIELFTKMNSSISNDFSLLAKTLADTLSNEEVFQEYLTACSESIFNSDFFDLKENCIKQIRADQELCAQES